MLTLLFFFVIGFLLITYHKQTQTCCHHLNKTLSAPTLTVEHETAVVIDSIIPTHENVDDEKHDLVHVQTPSGPVAEPSTPVSNPDFHLKLIDLQNQLSRAQAEIQSLTSRLAQATTNRYPH